MSTISISAGTRFDSARFDSARLERARRAAASGPLKLTRRGQLVVVAAFLLAAFAVMVLLGGFATATGEGGEPAPVKIVEVQPGDTLYGIAGEVAEPGKVREVVHRIQQLNALEGGALQVGDRIAVPLG